MWQFSADSSLFKQREVSAVLSGKRCAEYARRHICRGRDKDKFVLYDVGGPERGLVAATSKNHIGQRLCSVAAVPLRAVIVNTTTSRV